MTASKIENLTVRTTRALRQRIAQSSTRVGDKLPTEKMLATEFGVSRTVIREAIVALRADGLLKAVHGVGYFITRKDVTNDTPAPLAPVSPHGLSPLDLLEFRMAVEIHAAGLAAARRSWAQEEKIWRCAAQFEQALRSFVPTEAFDWSFHRAISEATNNAAFVQFFDQLGHGILPRKALGQDKGANLITPAYLERSIGEHRAICQAIRDADVEGAMAATKAHLGKSHLLYHGLAGSDREGGA